MLSGVLDSIVRHPLRAWRARRAAGWYRSALAQKDAGNLEGARRDLERAVAADPAHWEAHRWLGILLARSQDYIESARHLEQALALNPGHAEMWIELGNVHALAGDLAKAGASFQAGLNAQPDCALAHLNLGVVLKEAGRIDEAIGHLRAAYELAPDADNVLRNLVSTLVEADLCEEALSVASAHAARRSEDYEARLLQGLALQKLHRAEEALACYEAAARQCQADPELHDNRGTALLELGRVSEAIESYDRALALRPDFALPAFHRALAYLLLGDYRRGWEHYELRQLNKDYPRHPAHYPRWDGSDLAGRTLLVLREQGLGDEIMFASCLPDLMRVAKRCIVECEPRLVKLFRRSFPGAAVYASTPDGALPAELGASRIDVAIPAGSVPRFLRRDAVDFPAHDGYLRADAVRITQWRERLARLGPGLKVGVSWTGGVRKTRRAMRSIPVEQWLPILTTPGVHLVSLQYTPDAAATVATLEADHGVRIEHWQEAIDDYDETAALVCALDLVVSVCTAVIHLGGALGRPVWVLAPYSPEWRYGFSGGTMPWYPSVRVFRQPAFGAWEPVIASAATELRRVAGSPS